MQLPRLKRGFYAVFLEELTLHVRLGVLPHEVRPQMVRFDLTAVISRIGAGDGIEDVVDYNHLRDTVTELVEERAFGLQETLCEAISERLLALPHVHGVVVETRKLSVYEDAAAVGCRMETIAEEALV